MVTSIYYDPVDYDCIDKVVDVRIALMGSSNSRLITFEVSYRRKEGSYQTHTIPTHLTQINRMLEKLKKKGLLAEAEFCKLHKELESLDSRIIGTPRLLRLPY